MNLRVTLHSSSRSGALVLAVKHRIEKYIIFFKVEPKLQCTMGSFLE